MFKHPSLPIKYMPIRKIYVCLLFILLSIPAAFSQIKPSDSQPLGYGIKLGINYSTIGTQYPDFYSGTGSGTLGMFFTKPINHRFTWFLEPAFSSVAFREEESENRYQNHYIDASGFVYFYPSSRNVDFAFIGGLRPSYLLSHKSEVFSGGNYLVKDLDANKNSNGQIDVGLMMGLSIALSPVVNLEMIYNHSATNDNSTQEIKGRASTVEINLRLNALALKKSLDGKSQSTQEMVEYYNKGVALVMLTTPNQAEIKRLTKEGKTEAIELLYAEMAERNAKVVDNFSRGFTFCPVYFFMDTSVYKVISGAKEGMFLNKNLQFDPSIKLPDSSHFFIASFCEDISNYTKRKHFGLFVYDDKMIQMDKPFNHPNQLAYPIYEYVRVRDPENKYSRATYNTVPYEKLLGKLMTRLYRNM
jgi:hypothetical protein